MAGGPYFWVGGSGTWDATTTTNWATSSGGAGGAGVPAATDNVTFDTLSNATLYTVTVATGATCANLSAAGPLTGNVTFSGTGTSSIAGSFTLAATGVTWSVTGIMTFSSTTTGKTITTNGTSLSSVPITFNGAGGSWALGSALTCNALTVTLGSFDTSSFAITCSGLNASGSSTRSITLGSSAITSSTSIAVNFSTSTGLTFNAGTSTITATSNATSINGGGKTFYNVVASNTTTGGGLTLNQANTFNSVTVNPPSTGVRFLTLSANQTITGTLVASGGSVSGRVFVRTSAQGTVFTLSVAAFSGFSDIDFRDITAAGTASWSTGTRIGDCTGNTGITFSTAKTVYWNLAGTQNISAVGWATSSGGSPSANNFPLAQDIAVFDNVGAAGALTIDAANWNIGAFDFSTRTSAMSLVGSPPVIYKYFVWPSTLTVTAAVNLLFAGANAKTNTTQGYNTLAITLQDSLGGSLTFQDATTITGVLTLTSGTLNTNSFSVQASSFISNSGLVRTLTLGSSAVTITATGGWTVTAGSQTINAGTSTISLTAATAKTFSGGAALTYYNINQGGAGALTIATAGMVFNDLQNSYSSTGATTITLQSTSLSVANFTATGTVGKVLTLNSSVAGTARPITKTGGGTVSVDYLAISDSTATGTGASWYAGANSTNVTPSTNTGWIFTAPPGGGVTVPVTSVTGTGAIGTVTVAGAANTSVTGVVATAAIGTVTVNTAGDVTVIVTGVQATAAIGTITVALITGVTVLVTGVQAIGAIGTVTVSTGQPVAQGGGGSNKRPFIYETEIDVPVKKLVRVDGTAIVKGLSSTVRIGWAQVAATRSVNAEARSVCARAGLSSVEACEVQNVCVEAQAVYGTTRASRIYVKAIQNLSDEALVLLLAEV